MSELPVAYLRKQPVPDIIYSPRVFFFVCFLSPPSLFINKTSKLLSDFWEKMFCFAAHLYCCTLFCCCFNETIYSTTAVLSIFPLLPVKPMPSGEGIQRRIFPSLAISFLTLAISLLESLASL